MKTFHLKLAGGGSIVEVRAVAHETYRKVASWHYVCVVMFEVGGRERVLDVEPSRLCYDHNDPAAQAEYAIVSDALADHLEREGHWEHKGKQMRDGRIAFWFANKPSGSTFVSEVTA